MDETGLLLLFEPLTSSLFDQFEPLTKVEHQQVFQASPHWVELSRQVIRLQIQYAHTAVMQLLHRPHHANVTNACI
jgi:hypothetical protein